MNPTKIKPTGYRVLLKTAVFDKVSPGGIILPEDDVSREQLGAVLHEVIAMGPTAFKHDMFDGFTAEVGDVVVTASYPGQEIRSEEDDTYWICNDEDILGIQNG